MTDGANRKLLLLAGPSTWRVIADTTGQHLQQQVNTKWLPVKVAGAANLTSPVRFTDTANMNFRLLPRAVLT